MPEPLPLTGYADPINVAPGQRVRFHVSSPGPYDAALVQLVHADDDPRGPGFKEIEVPSPGDGRYDGRLQHVWMGSCGWVPSSALLDVESLTIQAWVCPTLLDIARPQAILAKWSSDESTGYALVVEPEGEIALWLGDGSSVSRIRTGTRLYAPAWYHREWYFVAATFDAQTGAATVEQTPVSFWPMHPGAGSARAELEGRPSPTDAPLVLAAAGSGVPFSHHLNGLLDRPRLFGRALTPDELDALRADADPTSVAGDALVASWDFSRDMASDTAVDVGPNRLHARLRNEPGRAMTGARWRRRETDWRHAPDEYSAVYFHEDDVGDAEWEPDVELAVPDDLRSGAYAMRLRLEDGTEDRIPFFVRPRTGEATSDVAVLFPTMTYLAYSNDHSMAWWLLHGDSPSGTWDNELQLRRIEGAPYLGPKDLVIRAHPELGSCVYDRLRDGSGPTNVSSRRPILNLRPDYVSWYTRTRRHFARDLCLVDWLRELSIDYDALTDHDLHAHGDELLSPYRVLILCSHPEYWSQQTYDALRAFIERGGRVMYLGGNSLYYVTSIVPERPWIMECRKTWDYVDAAGPPKRGGGPSYGVLSWERVHSTGELGGMFQYRGQSERDTLGVAVCAGAWQRKTPGYKRLPASFDERARFIFEGIDANELIGDFGLAQDGAAGDEIDCVDLGPGTPPHILVLATSAGLHTEGGAASPKWVRADLAYMEGPKGGAVFSVGSLNWLSSLSWNGYDNNVSRITRNVLERFRDPEPLESRGEDVRAGEQPAAVTHLQPAAAGGGGAHDQRPAP